MARQALRNGAPRRVRRGPVWTVWVGRRSRTGGGTTGAGRQRGNDVAKVVDHSEGSGVGGGGRSSTGSSCCGGESGANDWSSAGSSCRGGESGVDDRSSNPTIIDPSGSGSSRGGRGVGGGGGSSPAKASNRLADQSPELFESQSPLQESDMIGTSSCLRWQAGESVNFWSSQGLQLVPGCPFTLQSRLGHQGWGGSSTGPEMRSVGRWISME